MKRHTLPWNPTAGLYFSRFMGDRTTAGRGADYANPIRHAHSVHRIGKWGDRAIWLVAIVWVLATIVARWLP